ncbi:MAG: RiPP biosynthesis methyltransferase ApyS [Actinomycetota bacterium]
MSRPKPDRLSTLDLVEAFHLGHAVSTLHELKVLALLNEPASAEEVAAELELDPGLLRGTLDYVAARTDLLSEADGRFVTTAEYADGARFLLDLYAGAYRSNAVQLERLLRQPSLAAKVVDRSRHARAFQGVGPRALGALPHIIRQLEFNHVLDVGCGPASLLLQLAEDDQQFAGWGLELNPAMRRAARAAVRAAGVGERVKILAGDSRDLEAALPPGIRPSIRAVTASHVANEMFGDGPGGAVSWLRGLRQALPGRPLLLSDYYGRLGSNAKGQRRETLLHDYVQLISGQGVPPARLIEWRAIYADAGCRLAHVIEDRTSTQFIHIVVL